MGSGYDLGAKVQHPGKVELQRQLFLGAKYFGLGQQGIDHLVSTARIVLCEDERVICRSTERDGMINFLISGAARIDLVRPRPHTAQQAEKPAPILKLIAPGEFFCLAPPPKDGSYYLQALSHPRADRQVDALVALWAQAAIRQLFEIMPPSGSFALLTTSWMILARVAEEKALLLAMPLVDRLRHVLHRLARRFARSHELGTLIDLRLPDAVLGALVCADRCAVNRKLQILRDVGEVARADRNVLVLVRTPLN